MKHSLKTGLGFGVTSGIITTIGLMVGLNAGTQSKLAIIGGLLTIAIADAFSDALGIHISTEFENKSNTREIWESTLTTFFSKFFIAIFFVFPLFVLPLSIAINVNILLGITFLGCFSYYIAKQRKANAWYVIAEHLFIAIVVIIIAQCTGSWIRQFFT